ncbi:GM19744 [Drosophila sechellia]|uniref:GM19744 n=1 Tax=Drosophila sechellia TaxID=7238 RepID=B4IIU4_DROSE|nr:GM19744 [Drosophila sechellia]
MKPEGQNNFSQKSRSSPDSSTENNSSSSDSEMEFVGTSAQGILKHKNKDERKISELKRMLAETEINLKAQQEKGSMLENCIKDKDDLIKTLQLSIDLVSQTKEMTIQKIAIKDNDGGNRAPAHDKVVKERKELNMENGKFREGNDQIVEIEKILKSKEEEIARLEFKIDESKLKIVKLEGAVKAKDEKIVKMKEILSEYNGTEYNKDDDEFVFLGFSKVPSIKLVTLPNFEPFASAFEDIPSAGRGWMVIQRRIDGSFDDVISSKLKPGCGDLGGEFWLGLEKLHKMTTNRRMELYIQLVDFDDVSAYARYDHFVIGGAKENYKLLCIGKYSGNAGDAFSSHINQPFDDFNLFRSMTYHPSKWWGTMNCNLNGIYQKSKVELLTPDGIWWGNWNLGKRISLKSCKMLIRPVVSQV